jgi:hypothetical protein
VLSDALLPVQERPPVAHQVRRPHDRHGDGQCRQTGDGQDGIDEPFGPGVPDRVQLVDVEEQGDTLQLIHRELSQPLVVEERQRADADALCMQR